MSWIQENQRQGLMLISRCMQKPGSWITERIADGNLSESILTLFQEKDSQDNSSHTLSQALADLQSILKLYGQKMPEEIQKELARQYIRWTRVETNTMTAANPPSPFQEEEDPLSSYRHLPGQEIMEWYHCCGMKIPKRFVGRPDSIHMKLEFAVYLTGNIPRHPDDPDYQKTYQAFLRRFLLPHLDRILTHRCGREQFPFYYLLCALIQAYLT